MANILIIGDDDSIRESLDMCLTEENCDVEVAYKGLAEISKFIALQAGLIYPNLDSRT